MCHVLGRDDPIHVHPQQARMLDHAGQRSRCDTTHPHRRQRPLARQTLEMLHQRVARVHPPRNGPRPARTSAPRRHCNGSSGSEVPGRPRPVFRKRAERRCRDRPAVGKLDRPAVPPSGQPPAKSEGLHRATRDESLCSNATNLLSASACWSADDEPGGSTCTRPVSNNSRRNVDRDIFSHRDDFVSRVLVTLPRHAPDYHATSGALRQSIERLMPGNRVERRLRQRLTYREAGRRSPAPTMTRGSQAIAGLFLLLARGPAQRAEHELAAKRGIERSHVVPQLRVEKPASSDLAGPGHRMIRAHRLAA